MKRYLTQKILTVQIPTLFKKKTKKTNINYPSMSSALWVKSIKQIENGHRTLLKPLFPTLSPSLSPRCLLLYLQMNQSVSQRWAVCLHKHHLLTSQRTNKGMEKKIEIKSNQGK